MAKSHTSKRDEKHELTRRALIKWSVATGAALGVSRSKIYEILERTAGKSVAFAAAAQLMNRTVNVACGNGSLAWKMLSWPLPAIAAAATPTNNFPWHKPGQQTVVQGTDRPLVSGPDTIFSKLPASKQITAFVCGGNDTHQAQPNLNGTIGGNGVIAACAALQTAVPAVIPTVIVGRNLTIGTAPGAGPAAVVPDAAGFSGLFSSAASRAGGLLANSNDAALYSSHYNAFIQLNRAAGRPTTNLGYETAANAAKFLGTNLSTQLAVTQTDLDKYGITSTTNTAIANMGKTLIVTTKAFKLGLTNSIVLPSTMDDPHAGFDGGGVNVIPPQFKAIFDGFMTDLQTTMDDTTQKALADNTVITFSGDTPKSYLDKNGWGDGTSMNSNILFVYSAGWLNTGWHGDVSTTGVVQGVGPDGKLTTYNAANTAKYALASVLYAVAQGDSRAIQNLAAGVQVAGIFGRVPNI
jgi:hypothetical protein